MARVALEQVAHRVAAVGDRAPAAVGLGELERALEGADGGVALAEAVPGDGLDESGLDGDLLGRGRRAEGGERGAGVALAEQGAGVDDAALRRVGGERADRRAVAEVQQRAGVPRGQRAGEMVVPGACAGAEVAGGGEVRGGLGVLAAGERELAADGDEGDLERGLGDSWSTSSARLSHVSASSPCSASVATAASAA